MGDCRETQGCRAGGGSPEVRFDVFKCSLSTGSPHPHPASPLSTTLTTAFSSPFLFSDILEFQGRPRLGSGAISRALVW